VRLENTAPHSVFTSLQSFASNNAHANHQLNQILLNNHSPTGRIAMLLKIVASARATNVVEPSVDARFTPCTLEPAWFITIAGRVGSMDSTFIGKTYKVVARETLDVRSASITLAIGHSGGAASGWLLTVSANISWRRICWRRAIPERWW